MPATNLERERESTRTCSVVDRMALGEKMIAGTTVCPLFLMIVCIFLVQSEAAFTCAYKGSSKKISLLLLAQEPRQRTNVCSAVTTLHLTPTLTRAALSMAKRVASIVDVVSSAFLRRYQIILLFVSH